MMTGAPTRYEQDVNPEATLDFSCINSDFKLINSLR